MLRTAVSRVSGRTAPQGASSLSVLVGGGEESSAVREFGENVVPLDGILAPESWAKIQAKIEGHVTLDMEEANEIAAAVLEWAEGQGVTHYTHWFQPMTGGSAQKHDAFLKPTGPRSAISDFRGKHLLCGEPDGSSFPNGGLRATHEARGYTVWDPASPLFVMHEAGASTLYIPSVFMSWHGAALDEKLPLLRSERALEREVLRSLAAMGEEGHTRAAADSGIEQEFFVVAKEDLNTRPDLVACGRTLLGAPAARGQSLDDHYFASLEPRVAEFLAAAERTLWGAGVPVTTRHKEVAPGQYEIAPVFARASVAADQNLLTMEVLGDTAREHGLVVLFHEKPFAGLNGSGKHNNWSVGTNLVGSLLTPGDDPASNAPFMVLLAALVRGVDLHQGVLRACVASASNDHRLGANEAPPAIMSVFLGGVAEAVDALLDGREEVAFSPGAPLDGVGLGPFTPDTTDRNRTSPIAFTGNKFELRAVGSSQSPARSSTALNTIVAAALADLTAEIDAAVEPDADASTRRMAALRVAVDTLRRHRRIIFNGDNYADAWTAEAESRGLLNLRTTLDALPHAGGQAAVELFEGQGVLSRAEVVSRMEAQREEYVTTVREEAGQMLRMARAGCLPAAAKTQTTLASALVAVHAAGVPADATVAQREAVASFTAAMEEAAAAAAALEAAQAAVGAAAEAEEAHTREAEAIKDGLLPAMDRLRSACDALEERTEQWPFVSYHDMLMLRDL